MRPPKKIAAGYMLSEALYLTPKIGQNGFLQHFWRYSGLTRRYLMSIVCVGIKHGFFLGTWACVKKNLLHISMLRGPSATLNFSEIWHQINNNMLFTYW